MRPGKPVRKTLIALATGAALLFCAPAPAADNATGLVPATDNATDILSTTHHTLHRKSATIAYTATAGQLVLRDGRGRPTATIFFTAYCRDDSPPGTQPVTFAFNGGPGSSSIWLHFGALGPWRVALGKDGTPPQPPPRLLDNESSWLPFTDLVFIDPVGTGYSRAVHAKKEKTFFDVRADISSVGDFIRLYLTQYERWLSPKYLVGESYGTTRAVGLAQYLPDRYGIDLSGIVLISPVLDFTTIMSHDEGILPAALFLPTYTAAAHYHGCLPGGRAPLSDAAGEACVWTLQNYLPVLARGAALSPQEHRDCAEALAQRTGLSPDYISRNDLTVPPARFRKQLLRERGLVLGRMDARFTGFETDRAADRTDTDPSLDQLIGTFSSAANHYNRSVLKFKSRAVYEHLNPAVSRQWEWGSGLSGGQGFVNVTEALARSLHANPHLRVLIALGYYDLATPFAAAAYTIDHLPIDPALRPNLQLRHYPGGHMMYIDADCRRRLTTDARTFYSSTPGGH